ncbi:hypothetical protein [Luteimonas aquatica]|uniref:hypothetical protein n=1 Tax=Luteimonas aquatica TaxID=450364 RepID=UPI001F5AC41F|nr:hypothetical protein [Luteimonas aquatica]
MTDRDLSKIELWCYDAASIVAPRLNAVVAAMLHENISKYANKKRDLLYIASDYAEMISSLADEDRAKAQKLLKEKHGFGYEHFQQGKLLAIESILKNGKIGSMSQYEKALDFLSDTTNDQDTLVSLSKIVAAHEEKLSKKQAKK